MTLQVLPPEMLEAPKVKIETKEPPALPETKRPQKMERVKEFRVLGCYETGHAIMGWQYASRVPWYAKTGDLRFDSFVVARHSSGAAR